MENKRVAVALDGSPPLPEEIIIFEIFARLPVKTLHRFRCVSKFCRSLTSHPPFLDAFRRHSRGRYVLSFTASWDWQHVFYYSNLEPFGESQTKIFDNDTAQTYYASIKFINGFMCVVRGGEVVIHNPATNEKFPLPKYPRDSRSVRHFVYFCYDPGTNRYKVLRTTFSSVRIQAMRHSIFTLGVDKSWRDCDEPKALYQLGNSKSACVNGVLFCTNFSTSRNIEDGVIAAYVVGKEYFDIVCYPEGLSPSRYRSCHLTDVKGSIAIVDAQNLGSCMIRLWTKIRRFGSEPWLEHRIQYPSSFVQNIFNVSCNFSFSTNRDNEIVMGLSGKSTGLCRVFCHNLETGNWRRIDMVGIKPHVILGGFFIEEYVETPLLLREIVNP